MSRISATLYESLDYGRVGDAKRRVCSECQSPIRIVLRRCRRCGTEKAERNFSYYNCADACESFGEMLRLSGIGAATVAGKMWKTHRFGAFCSEKCHNTQARRLMHALPQREDTRKWLAKAKQALRAVESLLSEKTQPPATQKAAPSRNGVSGRRKTSAT